MRSPMWRILGLLCLALFMPSASADSLWSAYARTFITPDGRVRDPVQGDISHSEGQGYAMLLAAAAGDEGGFNRLWDWTRRQLQREDKLFAWRWQPGREPAVADWNNATDGDLLIAWALAWAGERWRRPELDAEAAAIARRIRTALTRPTAFGLALLPALYGFEDGPRTRLNPSYWVYPAMRWLDRVDPAPAWRELEHSGLRLLSRSGYGPHGLPPDWIDLHHADGRLALPQEPQRRRHGLEAARIPLYLCWAGLRPMALQAYARAWADADAPAWIDLGTGDRAAYGLTRAQLAVRSLLPACVPPKRSALRAEDLDATDYYGSTLMLLVHISPPGRP
jgi:endoglucanase